MKQLTVKIGIAVVLLLFALFCNAQLVVPFDLRNQYVVKCYQLSSEQLNDYEKVLGDILSKWEVTLTDFTLHFCCCFTELLYYSLFIPLLDNFTCMKSVIETLYSDVLFAKLQSHAHICKLSFRK